MRIKRATVFGGSGFIGRHVVQRLAREGAIVRVAVRDPEEALFLKPMGGVGQIVPAYADVMDDASTAAAVAGADTVVNAVSLFVPRGKRSYDAVHVKGAARVAKAAAEAGAGRLVHLSGLGADAESENAYIKSRGEGDAAVLEAFPGASILRPSVVFGPGDSLFSAIGNLARYSPVMPLFGGGNAKVQPVYVGDVADAAMACLGRADAAGKAFELGGPQTYTYRQLFHLVNDATGRKRWIVGVPMWKARILSFFCRPLPEPPLSRDMLYLMSHDNMVDPAENDGFAALDLAPHTVEAMLPTLMDEYRRGGRWKPAKLA